MVPENNLAKDSAFGNIDLKGPKSRMEAGTLLRNRSTGKREPVLLIDPQDEQTERNLLADCSHNPELQADLSIALSAFSPIEKRIIFRVLLQGQSVEEATQGMRQSRRTWARWLNEQALPVLQVILSDYAADLAKVGVYLPSTTPLPVTDEESCPQTFTAKCKYCTHVAEDCTERLAFAALRLHSQECHEDMYRKVQSWVHERDYDIQRDEAQLRETNLPDDYGVEEVI